MREHWRDLELSKKLGYVWTVLFAILVLGTAGTLIIPAVLNYLEEKKAAAEEQMKEEAAPPEAAPQEAAPQEAPPPEANPQESGKQSRLPSAPPGLALRLETMQDGTLRLHRSALPSRGVPPASSLG